MSKEPPNVLKKFAVLVAVGFAIVSINFKVLSDDINYDSSSRLR